MDPNNQTVQTPLPTIPPPKPPFPVKWVVAGLIILILVIGAVVIFLIQQRLPNLFSKPLPAASLSPAPELNETAVKPPVNQDVEITRNGFSPSKVTIKVNEQVHWINKDTSARQIISADNPVYIPLNRMDPILPGKEAYFLFSGAGAYKYQDKSNPALQGEVLVEGITE